MTYLLVTDHDPDGRRVRHFDTYDEAEAAATATNPDLDGSLHPNVTLTDTELDNGLYERGFFWFGNRYAAILRKD